LKFKLHGKNSGAVEESNNKLDQLSLHEDKPKEENQTSI
jgi:hypothetical protein